MKKLVLIIGVTLGMMTITAWSQESAPTAAESSATSPVTAESEIAVAVKSSEQIQSLSAAELMYHVLVGELAVRRGQLNTALDNYRTAALASNDPQLAERAAGIALFVNENTILLDMARRWQSLLPTDLQALQSLVLALLRNGLVEEAMPQIEAILATQPDDAKGHGMLNALMGQIKDKAVILQVMTRLLERRPDSQYAFYQHALAAMEAGQAEVALSSLDKVLTLVPDWREAHLLRARIKVQNDDAEAGLTDLAAAVATQSDDYELRMGYARLLVAAEHLQEAREQFTQLAETRPDDPEALFALGVLALEAKQYDEARNYYLRVLDLGHRQMDVYFEMGRTEELSGDHQAAQDWYERVTEGERYLSSQVRAATMSVYMGKLEDMAVRLSELRQDNPDNAVSLYITESDLLRQEKQYQAAFERLDNALKEYPGNHDLLYSRALAAERLDRLDILEQDLRYILEADPENGHALNALGYTLADRTERYQEALALLEQAIKLLPDDPAVLDSMGWVKYRLGELDEAVQYLRRAYELNNDPEIVSHLSEVLWAIGEQEEAQTIWQDAYSKAPDNEFLLRAKEHFKP